MSRERWDKRTAFIMAAIGSAIGLGNVWRFPYMAYSNGGGAFFIPYLIALITTGIPLMALEYYLGTRYQAGPTEAYGFIKKKSNYIGWFAIAVAGMITFYYTVIMGWSWNYIFYSIGAKWTAYDGGASGFFFEKILGISEGINHMGGLRWGIVLGNLLTWVAIYFIIFKGVKIVGKVVNWTVGLPWLLLAILIIRGITLRGSAEGLNYYLNPDFSKLLEPSVWLGAYGQIFFSLSLGFGIMIAYASYLPKKSDINTNAWVVSFSNCATSFFAGFAVFSTLGYLAFASGQPVEHVAGSGGVGMAFVVFPTVIGKLPGGIITQSIFGILFFFMLLTLGIDSAFSLVEAIVTGLKDSFKLKRETATFWVCLVGFLVGLLYSSQAGLYYLDVVDHWMNWGLLIVGLLEAILIGWFFKTSDVAKDIDSTSSIKLGKFWLFMVKFFTPVVLIAILLTNFIGEFKSPYGGYPIWAVYTLGWGIMFVLIFISILIQDRNELKTMKNKFLRLIGWLIILAGLFLSFWFFYKATTRIIAALILIGSSLIGIFIISILRKKQVVQ